MAVPKTYEVELPTGGVLHLQTPEEVDMWDTARDRFVEDYHLTKANDLVLLGVILQQYLAVFRAQRALNGMQPELDGANVPTGRYVHVELKSEDYQTHVRNLNTASKEIRELEKALGIDKSSREAGGAVSVEQYLRTLKAAAKERGIHITERAVAYEAFVNDLRTKLRMLKNLDAEDRSYHGITPDSILDWAGQELLALEQVDQDFAQQKGKLYVGRL